MIIELNARSASRLLATVIIVGAMTAACAQERAAVTADSYQVYSAVLTQQYGSWFKDNHPVLIIPHTVLEPQGHPGYESCRASVEQDLLKVFDKLAAETREFRIETRLELPGPYKMLMGKTIIRENKEPGVVFLSAVEFSKDRSKALVLVGHSCAGLCGGGSVRSLEKRPDGWHLTNNQPNCGWIN